MFMCDEKNGILYQPARRPACPVRDGSRSLHERCSPLTRARGNNFVSGTVNDGHWGLTTSGTGD